MANKNFYITTPIYYVNDSPHIGHAYTTIACDVLARFKRLQGNNVRFLTGTDEHGQKVDKAANKAKKDPQDFVDDVAKRFQELVSMQDNEGAGNLLGVTNDDFIRTTQKRHKEAASKLWERLVQRGEIYLDTYKGWYSVRDEAYYLESELKEEDGKKIAPSGAPVEWVEEESYFFRLSKWQRPLLAFYGFDDEYYKQNPDFASRYPVNRDFVMPQSRLNEVVNFVKGGREFVEGAVRDLSISRTNFNWGVPVPGDTKHVMYVWIDALTNYLTSIEFPNLDSKKYKEFWENADQSPVHVIGKDILRFHAVYWPAFLMAAELPLPRRIVAHGWWTIEGQKMSKSLGNVIAPKDLIEQFGLDQTRYFLLREVPFGNDGNFAKQMMIERINSDLANNIGNLTQRTLSMIQKNFDGCLDIKTPQEITDTMLKIYEIEFNQYSEYMEQFNFNMAIDVILQLAKRANEYIDEKAPWALKKEGKLEQMQQVLYELTEYIRYVAIMLQPFTPLSAQKILLQLGYQLKDFDKENGGVGFDNLSSDIGFVVRKKLPVPEVVFPRVNK